MTKPLQNKLLAYWRADFVSAKGFYLRAALILVAFLVAHLAGLREYTTFITGTAAGTGASLRLSAIWGMIYLTLYFSAVILAPILILAATFWIGVERWNQKRRRANDH